MTIFAPLYFLITLTSSVILYIYIFKKKSFKDAYYLKMLIDLDEMTMMMMMLLMMSISIQTSHICSGRRQQDQHDYRDCFISEKNCDDKNLFMVNRRLLEESFIFISNQEQQLQQQQDDHQILKENCYENVGVLLARKQE